MSNWTGQAHLLADDIREPGFAAAALNAAAWAAGVTPEATAGLIGAASALTSGECGAQLWAHTAPVPDDRALLAATAELEGAVAQLLACATGMAQACRADLEAAVARASAAASALAAATTAAEKSAAEGAMAEAQAAIADCEAALEVINEAGSRLAHAANCLARVPDDLAAAYETPYGFVRDGGTLPHDGDFMTGGVSYEAA